MLLTTCLGKSCLSRAYVKFCVCPSFPFGIEDNCIQVKKISDSDSDSEVHFNITNRNLNEQNVNDGSTAESDND